MNSKQAFVLAKSAATAYTDETVEGLGYLKGAPCTIESIEPSPDGLYSTITFKWEGTGGTVVRDTLEVDNGIGIKSVDFSELGHLIITYDDDTTRDVGPMPMKTIEVGSTETVDYEEGADVIATETATGVSLDFKIPRGQKGDADPVWDII